MAIMEYLLAHPTHPTADTIFNDLTPTLPTLSKTTVYNTLRLLSEQGAILSISIDEKNVRYDGDIATHAHFKCKKCGCVYDLSIKGLDTVYVEGIGDLCVTECQLYYKGYCEKCKSKLT
jgi:Fur family ferric uptake transcriptional regulator/Fur family peroxide stress response transcriptional regulator